MLICEKWELLYLFWGDNSGKWKFRRNRNFPTQNPLIFEQNTTFFSRIPGAIENIPWTLKQWKKKWRIQACPTRKELHILDLLKVVGNRKTCSPKRWWNMVNYVVSVKNHQLNKSKLWAMFFFKYHGNSVWKLKDTHSILKGARVHKPEQKRWHALPETNIASA